MKHFIAISFLFLAWFFYAASGGSSFDGTAERKARELARAETAQSELLRKQAEWNVKNSPAAAITEATDVEIAQASAVPVPATTTRFQIVSLPISQTPEPESQDEAAVIQASLEFPAASTEEQDIAVIDEVRIVDLRLVDANRVNLRQGPGTEYSILGKLVRGEEVEILQIPGTGWVKLKTTESGRIGWMAERLLTAPLGS